MGVMRLLRALSKPRRWLQEWRSLTDAQQWAFVGWFVFTLCLGTVPFILACFGKLLGQDPHPLRSGDAYLMSSLIVFSGVGVLMTTSLKAQGWKARPADLGVVGLATMLAAVDAVSYAFEACSRTPNNWVVNTTSVLLYLLSALASVACVMAAEGR